GCGCADARRTAGAVVSAVVRKASRGPRVAVPAAEERRAPLALSEALESARHTLIVAHDRLTVATMNADVAEAVREAQTVLKVLSRSFQEGDAGRETRLLRKSFAREASKKLSRRTDPRDGKSARLPFGPALPPKRAANLHAEHVAWTLEQSEAVLQVGEKRTTWGKTKAL